MIPFHTFADAAEEAALLAGEILLKFFGKLESIQDKQYAGDLVTEADLASDSFLSSFFSSRFPDHSILTEESGSRQEKSPWQWVIDPLDGTTNFSHQHPMFSISIALLHQKKPVVGVIFDPLHGELFRAIEHQGATLNKRFIHVSKTSALEKSLLASGFPYDRRENPDNNYKEFCHLTHLTQGVRRCGSAALDLAYVAAGRLDGYWELGIKPWDVAAGVIIVQEAGGAVSRYDGTPLENLGEGRLIATNGLIHEELKQALRSCTRT